MYRNADLLILVTFALVVVAAAYAFAITCY